MYSEITTCSHFKSFKLTTLLTLYIARHSPSRLCRQSKMVNVKDQIETNDA